MQRLQVLTASTLDIIRQRADLYRAVRGYFESQSVSEVEVPLLGRSTATDPHLASMQVRSMGDSLYLQTSPELFMKRLLAGGSGSIFSICKSFRTGESSKRHNPEFSMLEWYRVGFDLAQIIDDVQRLIMKVLPSLTFQSISYAELFQTQLLFNPHRASEQELDAAVKARTTYDGSIRGGDLDRSSCLDLLMSQVVEPAIADIEGLFVVDYPSCQAAMAQIGKDLDGNTVAHRFELYLRGVEVANGYLELTDSVEQENRFKQDNRVREKLGLSQVNQDEKLLAALASGMPSCSGVALGLDRLLWLVQSTNKDRRQEMNIGDHILFPWSEI